MQADAGSAILIAIFIVCAGIIISYILKPPKLKGQKNLKEWKKK